MLYICTKILTARPLKSEYSRKMGQFRQKYGKQSNYNICYTHQKKPQYTHVLHRL